MICASTCRACACFALTEGSPVAVPAATTSRSNGKNECRRLSLQNPDHGLLRIACGRRTGGAGTSQVQQASRGLGHSQPVTRAKRAGIWPRTCAKPPGAWTAQSRRNRPAFLCYGPALVGGRRTRSAARLAGASAALRASPASPLPALRGQAIRCESRCRTLDRATHRALLDLYALDSRVCTPRRRGSTRSSARAARLRRAAGTARAATLGARSARSTVSQQQLGDKSALLYKQGDVSALAVVLGARIARRSRDEARRR